MIHAVLAFVLVATCLGCSREAKIVIIPIDGRPSAVTVSGGFVWVADDESHAVHLVDVDSNEVVGQPIAVAKNPVALVADDQWIYVSHASGVLGRIDVRTRRWQEEFRTDASFIDVEVDGDTVWAADAEKGLFTFENWDLRGIDRMPDGAAAVRLVATSDTLWVSGRENTVTRVKGERQSTYDVGNGPIGVVFDGRDVWVANSDDNTVQTVDGERVVGVGKAPVAMAMIDRTVWVANQDDQTISRVAPDNSVESIPVPVRPRGISASSGAIWVVGVNESALVRVVP